MADEEGQAGDEQPPKSESHGETPPQPAEEAAPPQDEAPPSTASTTQPSEGATAGSTTSQPTPSTEGTRKPSNFSMKGNKPSNLTDTGSFSGSGSSSDDEQPDTEQTDDDELQEHHMEAYAALEKEFQRVLDDLSQQKDMEMFRDEYQKVFDALQKGQTNERRLLTKCKKLQADMAANAAKVTAALKLTREDQKTITSLKAEMEKAWKMLDQASLRERDAAETIDSLKTEVVNLNRAIDQGFNLTGDQDTVREMRRQRDELKKERDALLLDVVRLKEQLTAVLDKQAAFEKEKEKMEGQVSNMLAEILEKNAEIHRELRRKERSEKDLKEVRQELERKQLDMNILDQQIRHSGEVVINLDNQLKEQKLANEGQTRELDDLNQKLQKLQNDYEVQGTTLDRLMQETIQKQSELKSKEEEVGLVRQEMLRVVKQKDTAQKRVHQLEDAKYLLDRERDLYKTKIMTYEKKIEGDRRQAESNRKAIDDLMRDRDALAKNVLKAQAQTDKQMNMVKLHEQAKINLEHEISNYKNESTKQRKLIFTLEKDRDKYVGDVQSLSHKLAMMMEELKMTELDIFEGRKKLTELEHKLKYQELLYENTRTERNTYSKNYAEAQDEISEMTQKLRVMTHQISQMKEEITSKDELLLKEKFDHERVEQEKEKLRLDLDRLRQETAACKSNIEALQAEQNRLEKIILEAEREKRRQREQMEKIMNERDILGTQLVRRNDELTLLYEKVKIQEGALAKGESQYEARIEDIRVLKMEVRRLRRDKTVLATSVANLSSLQKEVFRLHKNLVKERARTKALEDQLQNPLNVHRWRRLQGTDPTSMDLIEKIRSLQRRLLAKSEEAVRKEQMIREKERLYVELRRILLRAPGPELADEVHRYKSLLREKERQVRGLHGELLAQTGQSKLYKEDLAGLAKEMHEIKKKYFQKKKYEEMIREKERDLLKREKSLKTKPPRFLPPIIPQGRFVGGGFRLLPSNRHEDGF